MWHEAQRLLPTNFAVAWNPFAAFAWHFLHLPSSTSGLFAISWWQSSHAVILSWSIASAPGIVCAAAARAINRATTSAAARTG